MSYARFVAGFHRHASQDPNVRLALGLEGRLDELPDPSLEAAVDRVRSARALLGVLAVVEREERSTLSFDDALDVDLARLQLEAEIHKLTHTFNGRTELAQLPKAADEVADPLVLLMLVDPRPHDERVQDVLRRIQRVPRYLAGMLARLDRPVRRWVEVEREKLAELPAMFESVAAWAGSNVGDLARASAVAVDAVAAYADALARLPTTDAIHLEVEVARKTVALRGIEASLEALHRDATDALRVNTERLNELGARLSSKYGERDLQRLLGAIERAHPVPADRDPVEWSDERRQAIQAFVLDNDLFDVSDEHLISVLATPACLHATIPMAFVVPPSPFREGPLTSLVYVTPGGGGASALFRTSLLIHEAIPGHHLQLGAGVRHPSVVRRHMQAIDQSEGWATMMEQYMVGAGLYGELTDEARFLVEWSMRRVPVRAAIDLFFMTGERGYLDLGVDVDVSSPDPFVAAGNLLSVVTGYSAPRVAGELNWYSQERGYPACFLAGNKGVWALFERMRSKTGLEGRVLERRFHHAFLSAGYMPLAHLARAFAHAGLIDDKASSSSAVAASSRS